MKKVYIGIFAHPDDESFGPSGSFLKYISEGADVHLICATCGQSGQNAIDAHDLADTRKQEWLTAGKILGAKCMYCLDFYDGELSNNQFHEIARTCEQKIKEIGVQYPANTEIILVTMDANGLSGHIDHVVMSHVTSYVFMRMREYESRLRDVHYYCLSENDEPTPNSSFVFMPKGRALHEITITNDVTQFFDTKKELMNAHASQAADAKEILKKLEQSHVKQEHFYTFSD